MELVEKRDGDLIKQIETDMITEYKINIAEQCFYRLIIDFIYSDTEEFLIEDLDKGQFIHKERLFIDSDRYSFYINKEYIVDKIYNQVNGFPVPQTRRRIRYSLYADSKIFDIKDIELVYIEIGEKSEYYTKDSFVTENKINLYYDIYKEIKEDE